MMAHLAQYARFLTLTGVLIAAPVVALLGIPPRWPSELATSWDDISGRCHPSQWRPAIAKWLPAMRDRSTVAEAGAAPVRDAIAHNPVMPEHALPGTYDARQAAAAASQSTAYPSALASVAEGPEGEPPLANRFRQIQERLEALGATYMRLEADPNDRGRYRFYCQMALAEHYGNAAGQASHHPFEAIADDPVLAMERVLANVESWRAGRM